MADVIENPVLNSPFSEPQRHFVFSETGITNEIAEARRISAYFIPIPPPKKLGGQMALQVSWTSERVKPNDEINRIRGRVDAWRKLGYPGVTNITRGLLDYWRDPERERPLFFCQVEALETAIYINEVASRHGDTWIENQLREHNVAFNSGLPRVGIKMATGSGKTVVMAMIIAWQALNKINDSTDRRFSDTFLIVTPGITIRDRLRVLLPNLPGNFYTERDLVTADQLETLQRAKILITNYHTFSRRETLDAASLTKKVLAGPGGDVGAFRETLDEMVRRVCRTFGSKKNIVVLNDEAHHCYREKPDADEEKLESDEKVEAQKNLEAARVWMSGLEAVRSKIGIKTVYDLSATPFFLRGSGYGEGTMFPWIVSDFSLIDAIECGIVKVPRVPIADDQMAGELPVYRDLWARIRKDLPKKGRSAADAGGEPKLPKELEGALLSLYGNYEKSYRRWEEQGAGTPPVFIVVCNNTNVSKMVFDWIAGWVKNVGTNGATPVVPGHLPILSNESEGTWLSRPNTLLIDSAQLESGQAMDEAFKKLIATEIEEVKSEFRLRFPGRDVDLTDEDLLREVINTVGKPGKLGEQVKCVVSVSMLTEGWDANTVTHILGVRAFGTQLLCEQVVGRGLRRISYEADANGMFDPEYAEVYGVPFSFIPTAGTNPDPKPPKPVHRVRAMKDRIALEITYPRVTGYRYDLPAEHLDASFSDESHLALSAEEMPLRTELRGIAGETQTHTLDELKARRLQEIGFAIAKLTLDQYLPDADGSPRPWLFPQLVAITQRWMSECVTCKDSAFLQMLWIGEYRHLAAERIQRALVEGTRGEKRLLPILRGYEPLGSTQNVTFDTTKAIYETDPRKCHLNYVTLDSNWEAKMAQALEWCDEVVCYVKNQGLGFTIPYVFEGDAASYVPDYIVRWDRGGSEPLNLVLEVSGEAKKAKAAKVATAETLWVPAVNNHGGFGRWGFIDIRDPYDAINLVRAKFARVPEVAGGKIGAEA